MRSERKADWPRHAPVWLGNVPAVSRHEGYGVVRNGKCGCIACICCSCEGLFEEGPARPVPGFTLEDLSELGFVGLYRVRRRPWKP